MILSSREQKNYYKCNHLRKEKDKKWILGKGYLLNLGKGLHFSYTLYYSRL